MGYYDEKKAIDIYSELCKSRIIRLDGEVDGETSRTICSLLTIMDNDIENRKKPIWLYINSPGGSVYDGMAIIDTMKTIKSPVYTVVCGLAASMGSAILSAGDKRFATKNSTVMLHQASSGTKGNVQDQVVALNETIRVNNLLVEMIANNCGKTKEELLAATNRDYFLSADQAVEFKIVDEILDYTNKTMADGDDE